MDINQALILQQKPLAIFAEFDQYKVSDKWQFVDALCRAVNFARACRGISQLVVQIQNKDSGNNLPDFIEILLKSLRIENEILDFVIDAIAIDGTYVKVTISAK